MLGAVTAIVAIGVLAGCDDDATVASRNLSKAADNFEIVRRVVFVNGITDKYLLSVEGRCSLEDTGLQVKVICKDSNGQFRRHHMGRSNNVTYVVEHLEPTSVSTNHYRFTFKPDVIVPEIDLRGTLDSAPTEESKSQ